MSQYEHLISTLARFEEEAKAGPLSLGRAMDSLDGGAYPLIALILILPFMQPIPTGPLSILGGLTFATLGWQMWRGHQTPVLPEKVRNVVMSQQTWKVLANLSLKVVSFCRKFTRARLTTLVEGRKGQKLAAFVMILAGLLMAIPFGVLPLNNVFPGLAILFLCFGLMEDDGLMTVIAIFWIFVTIIYFTAFFLGLYFLGNEVFEYFKFGG